MTEGVGSMQALILKQNIFFTLTVTFEPLGSSTFYTVPPFLSDPYRGSDLETALWLFSLFSVT